MLLYETLPSCSWSLFPTWRFERFLLTFGDELSISTISVSSNEWVGDIGGNGEEAVGEPVAEGLDLLEVSYIQSLLFQGEGFWG